MAVRDSNVDPRSAVAQEVVAPEIVTATGLTNAVVFSYQPGYAFQVTRVRSFCRAKAGAVSYVVKVGGRTAVAAGTFTAATEVGAALSSTLANIRGSRTEAITIEITTDGTGALTNGRIVLAFRPFPMNGEASVGP